jgi:hypothetical protein
MSLEHGSIIYVNVQKEHKPSGPASSAIMLGSIAG